MIYPYWVETKQNNTRQRNKTKTQKQNTEQKKIIKTYLITKVQF